MSAGPEQKLANFLDRSAFYDGRLAALTDANALFLAAVARLEELGPIPTSNSPPLDVLTYQVRVATAAGTIFREIGDRLTELVDKARDEREVLLRDRAIDLDGEAMH
jgi:hypothetical protein